MHQRLLLAALCERAAQALDSIGSDTPADQASAALADLYAHLVELGWAPPDKVRKLMHYAAQVRDAELDALLQDDPPNDGPWPPLR